jgi:hypothetical protein
MKITPDNPALTAYALGELNVSDSAKVATALASDDHLAREGAAISSLAGILTDTLRGEKLSLGDERRNEILRAGRRPDAEVLVLEHRKRSRRQSIVAFAGVAAVVAAGFVGLSRMGVDSRQIPGSGDSAGLGTSAPSMVPSTEGGISDVASNAISPEVEPIIIVPLNVETADPSIVEKSLNSAGRLPNRDQFEIEAWVNLSPTTVDAQVTVGKVNAYTELGTCPWDDTRSLLMVSLRPIDGRSAMIKATLNFNPYRVKSARLLTSRNTDESGEVQPESLKSAQTIFYELELLEGNDSVGSVDLKSDEGEGYLPLSGAKRETPSLDFSVARVLAGFAKWGGSEQRQPETLRDLADEARSLLAKVTNEKARYALDMILLSEEG